LALTSTIDLRNIHVSKGTTITYRDFLSNSWNISIAFILLISGYVRGDIIILLLVDPDHGSKRRNYFDYSYFYISSNIVEIKSIVLYSAGMKLDTAALILSKIGNPTRLKIVRLLVRAGEQGMSVGAIQSRLGIPGSTLTHHISHLKKAGLIRQEREQATLFCKMEYERLEHLVSYLTEECCVDETASADSRVA